MLRYAEPGATFLLNAPFAPEAVWDQLPRPVQAHDHREAAASCTSSTPTKWRKETGMGSRINTVMQTCFFAISGVLPREEAIAQIKKSIVKTYGKRGESVVQKNFAAVDRTIDRLSEVKIPATATSTTELRPPVPAQAPEFVRNVLGPIISGDGDMLPVSAMPVDGTFPTGTAAWEKRNIALEIPVWDEKLCIQCGKCVLVCPHATIRAKIFDRRSLAGQPESFKAVEARWKDYKRAGLQPAGGARGLHRLRAVRASLPGEGQERHQAPRHQHAGAGSAARHRGRQLGFLPHAAGIRPQ